MTKKDYELIAGAFKAELDNLERLLRFKVGRGRKVSSFNEGQMQQLKTCIQTICDRLATDNPRFDRNKFLQACGLGVLDCTHSATMVRYNSFWSECPNCGMQVDDNGNVHNSFERPMFKQ